MTICQPTNIDGSKSLNHSFKTFSSLAGLISHHTESINSNTKISSQSNTSAQPFSSLAALTADYLQKSNAVNNIESRQKHQSPISQFVIPKLSINKKDSEETKNVHLLKSYNNENSKTQIISTNILSKHEIDLLQKEFSNMDIFSKNNVGRDIKSKEQFKNPISIINEICTVVPDDWVDLSTALKEAEFLVDGAFRNTNLTTSRKYRNMHNLEICLENDNRVTQDVLPVTLNLCALKYVKLPYTKKTISIFGKTLCKKWKIKKPVLKTIVQHYKMVKPFDFSTSYQN